MDRRGVLKGLGVAAAAALWPGWVREAFAGPPSGVLEGAATLIAAVERARARLRPLLVFVVPEDDQAKYYRGRHFGEWLNHGGDADLAPLACADVVCAGMKTVRALLPGAPADGEPAVLLLDTSRSPVRLSVALAAFPHRDVTAREEFAEPPGINSMTREEQREASRARHERLFGNEEAEITACIHAAGAAVRAALFGDLAELKRRAGERWGLLTTAARAEVRRIYDGVDGSTEQVLAAAPVLAVDAVDGGGNAPLLRLLARAARARYCGQAIPGSEWAQSEGCGVTVESGEDAGIVVCGMGHVPVRSQRFLYFFTRSSLEDAA